MTPEQIGVTIGLALMLIGFMIVMLSIYEMEFLLENWKIMKGVVVIIVDVLVIVELVVSKLRG